MDSTKYALFLRVPLPGLTKMIMIYHLMREDIGELSVVLMQKSTTLSVTNSG